MEKTAYMGSDISAAASEVIHSPDHPTKIRIILQPLIRKKIDANDKFLGLRNSDPNLQLQKLDQKDSACCAWGRSVIFNYIFLHLLYSFLLL